MDNHPLDRDDAFLKGVYQLTKDYERSTLNSALAKESRLTNIHFYDKIAYKVELNRAIYGIILVLYGLNKISFIF